MNQLRIKEQLKQQKAEAQAEKKRKREEEKENRKRLREEQRNHKAANSAQSKRPKRVTRCLNPACCQSLEGIVSSEMCKGCKARACLKEDCIKLLHIHCNSACPFL